MKAELYVGRDGQIMVQLIAESRTDKAQITRLKACWPIQFEGGIRGDTHVTFIGFNRRKLQQIEALRMVDNSRVI